MENRLHRYAARVLWEGNTGPGTSSYSAYARSYRVLIAGKPDLSGSADPAFRGEPGKHNPEDLFVASLSACHMLTYLAVCARSGIRVLTYEDEAVGTMLVDARGAGRFEKVTLFPKVGVAPGADLEKSRRLHEEAHAQCFIANSCSIPIHCVATVEER